MQSTGHASTQAVSFVPTHGSQIMYAIEFSLGLLVPVIKNETEIIHCTLLKSIWNRRDKPRIERMQRIRFVQFVQFVAYPSHYAFAESMRLRILPVGVRGRSATMSKYFG